jgi:hypothetical protein
MLNNLYVKINELTTPRNNWFFGLVALALTTVMLTLKLADNLAALMGYTNGQPMFAPDAGIFSSPDKLYAVLATYGDTGRKVYFYNSLLFDLAYPVFYSLALATLLNLVLGKLAGEHSPWRKVSLLPLLSGGLDLLENLSFYILIACYPARLDGLAVVSNLLTTAKGLLVYPCLVLLLLLTFILPFAKKRQPAVQPETLN